MNYTAAYLVSDGTKRAYPLDGPTPVTIGRDSVSHVVVDDPSVSRFHAEIRTDDRGRRPVYLFRSMGSAGSTINGDRASSERKLAEGDVIAIGSVVLRFTQEALPEGCAIVRPSDAPADSGALKQTQVVRSVEPETIGPSPVRDRRMLLVVAASSACVIAIGLVALILTRSH